MDKKNLVSFMVGLSLGLPSGVSLQKAAMTAPQPKLTVVPKLKQPGPIQNVVIIGDGRRCDFDKLAAKLPAEEACE